MEFTFTVLFLRGQIHKVQRATRLKSKLLEYVLFIYLFIFETMFHSSPRCACILASGPKKCVLYKVAVSWIPDSETIHA